MSRSDALTPYDRGPGEPLEGYVTTDDAKSSVGAMYDDLAAAAGVSIVEYGAVGDGMADDTAAIQAAIDTVSNAGGGTVVVPRGVYKTSAPITGGPGVRVVSIAPQYGATLKASGNYPLLSGVWSFCEVSGLTLDCDGLGGSGVSAHLDHATFRDVTIRKWNGFGMKLNDGTHAAGLGHLNRIQDCTMDSFPGEGVGVGIHAGYRFTDSWIEGCNVGSTLENINLEGGPVRVLGCHLDGKPERNIVLRGNRRIMIEGNILEGSSKEAILWTQPPWETFDTHQQIQIVGNAISNGGDGTGNYAAIRLAGLGSGHHGMGFQVVGNVIAFEDVGTGWGRTVHGSWVKHVSVVGNIWYDGFSAAEPVRFTDSSGYEVVGNHGMNAVATA